MIEHIKKWVEDNQNTILDVFNHFHENPEISWKEKKTKEYIIREAEQLGFHYKTFNQHYGVVLNWDGDTEGSTVALRTDMDALWQNVGGTWEANHSCGHDAHMTMVLLAARCLKEIGYVPAKGKIKFIFQPAEESGKGAIALLNDGVIDDVDYLLGVHVRPKVEMAFGQVSAGIYHGAAAMLKGRIKGIQAHGARPNQGINVIDSLGSIIYAVNSIKVDPTIPCSAKVTQVQAGGSNINIIPDDAEFSIDVRAQTNEALEDLLKKVKNAVLYAGMANGAEVTLEIVAEMAAARINSEMESIISTAISETLGEEALIKPPVTPGGEDFHFYTKVKPELKATMVGLGTDLEPGLHHPEMKFNKDALKNGIAVLATSIIKMYEHANNEKILENVR